ncbi:MAG TPA: efflux RND transporter periplasmic adaptor subunit [Ferruginibacter sp.]|nr:efflux RND transporter periplasmic adaptor subunit [Ferruginibacter sp.]
MKIFIGYLSAIAIVTLIATTGCNSSDGQTEPKPDLVVVPVLRLALKDTILEKEYVADIQASKNVEIRAMVPGFIEKIMVDEGQEVKKGQLLFQLNAAEYQTELSKTKAALADAVAEERSAMVEEKRVKILVDKNIISSTEYDLADSKVKSAQAKIGEAKSAEDAAAIRLSYTYICSPFTGVIDRIPEKVGSLVDQGTLLTCISDLQSMYTYFSVSENEYLKYAKATKANKFSGYDNIKLIMADGSEFPYKGKVETMESEIDSHTGSIAFRATFPNPEHLLKHGASGKIVVANALDNVLIVPQKSITEIQDKSFVYVLEKGNIVRMKSFVPGAKINESVIVQSGLSPNDVIVYEGTQNIEDGSSITPKYINADNLTAASFQ